LKVKYNCDLFFTKKSLYFKYKDYYFVMKRSVKELKLENEFLNIKVGTVNRFEPKTFYIMFSSWVTPRYNGDFEKDFYVILSDFKYELRKKLTKNDISQKFIIDCDINLKAMKENQKKMMSIQIILKQNTNLDFNLLIGKIKNDFDSLSVYLANKLQLNSFEMSKKR